MTSWLDRPIARALPRKRVAVRRVQLNFTLSSVLAGKVKQRSRDLGITQSEFIRQALYRALRRH